MHGLQRSIVLSSCLGLSGCTGDPIVDADNGGGTGTDSVADTGAGPGSAGTSDAETGEGPSTEVLIDGVSATTVRTFGVAAQTGPTRDLGIAMTHGIQAALDADDGPLRLQHFARDDGYVPENAAVVVDEITAQQGLREDTEPAGGAAGVEGRMAFAVLGSMGAPTAARMLPVILERQVPFIGTLGGGPELYREPPDPPVWQYRPSHEDEARALTRWLLDKALPVPAANVYVYAESPVNGEPCDFCEGNGGTAGRAAEALVDGQTVLNAYGIGAFAGARAALEGEGVSDADIALGTYRANSTDTSAAVDYFIKWSLGVSGGLGAEVPTDGETMRLGLLMAPTALPGAEFIKGVVEQIEQIRGGQKPAAVSDTEWASVSAARLTALSDVELTFAILSPVGDMLPATLRNDDPARFCGAGQMVVSQVVPFPEGASAAAVAYREDLAAMFPTEQPGFVTFEGWLVGKLWAEVIRRTVEDFGEVTEETVSSTMSGLSDPSGLDLPIDWGDQQASDSIYAARINEDCIYEDFAL